MAGKRGKLEIAHDDWLTAWRTFREAMKTGYITEDQMRQIAHAFLWSDLAYRDCPDKIRIVCDECKTEKPIDRRKKIPKRPRLAKVISLPSKS